MITLDTSAVVALLDRKDPYHQPAKSVLEQERGAYLVPVGILGEIGYFAGSKLGLAVLDTFLKDLEDGSLSGDCGEEDLPRVRELVGRYRDLPLSLADAVVIACAERNGGRVLTFDRRDFGVVAREGTIEVLPE